MLRELFPQGRFSPPASDAEIAAVEAALGVQFPKQLRDLYNICDGFREDQGNAKYLFALTDDDSIGSLLRITQFMWSEIKVPDLRSFIFFGSSSCDYSWGINWRKPDEVIAYHHHMEDEYELVGSKIIEVYQADYAGYGELPNATE